MGEETEYDRRYSAAVAEMQRAGIWRWNGEPPYVRLNRRIGLPTRPPYYVPFWTAVLSFGANFSLGLGLFTYCLQWQGPSRPLLSDVVALGVAGLCFGLAMAAWYRRVRVKHRLSRWEDLA